MVTNALARQRWDFDVPNVNNLLQPIQGGIDRYNRQAQQAVENERADEQLGMQRERLGFERSRMARQDESERLTRLGKAAAAIHQMPDGAEKAARAQALMAGHADLAPQFQRYGIDGANPVAAVGLLAQSWGDYDRLAARAKEAQINSAEASANLARAQAGVVGLTDAAKEYKFARDNGSFTGTFEQWKQKNAADSTKYGLTPIAIQRPDGSIGYVVPNTAGEAKELVLPNNSRVLPPATTTQTPTEVVVRDKFGNVVSREAKDVQGAAFDQVVGREAGEVAAGSTKAKAAIDAADAKSDRVLEVIQEAKPKIGALTAGFGGAALARLPGTAARDVSALLDTLKANAGFAELQSMRDNSPTGGALGQVAVQELAMLQATITSLEQAQTPQQLARALDTYEKFVRESKARRRAAYEATYRQQQRPASPGVVPRAGTPPAAPSQAAPTAPAQTPRAAGEPPTVRTVEEAMALPPGTVFRTPDGKLKVRP